MFTKILLVSLMMVVVVMGQAAEPRASVSSAQVNTALNNPRYIKQQIKCAIGEAPCDPAGQRLKKLAPQVLRGSCPQCSPDDVKKIKQVISHIQRKMPKEWAKVVRHFAGAH